MVVPLLPHCARVDDPEGGGGYGPVFVRYYVDDEILVEVQGWPDGRRCFTATHSFVSDRVRLLGVQGAKNLCCRPRVKYMVGIRAWKSWVSWSTLECMTGSLPVAKVDKLRDMSRRRSNTYRHYLGFSATHHMSCVRADSL